MVASDIHDNGLPESKSIDGKYAGNHYGFTIVVGNREELLRDDEDGEPKYFTPWEANQILAKPEHVTSDFVRRSAFNGDGMAVVDGKTGCVLATGMMGLSLKGAGRKGGGRHKSCKGLSKQMPNGGAFVIKCSEDRQNPLVIFLGGEEKECRLVMKRSSGGSEEKPGPSGGPPVTLATTPSKKEEDDEAPSVPFETLVDKLPPHLDKAVVEDCIGVAADLHKNGLPESKSRDGVYPGDHHGFSIAVGNREELLRDDEDGEPKYFTPWEPNQLLAKPEHITSEFVRRNAFHGDGMAVVDGKTGCLIAFGMIGLSLKYGGRKGGGRQKSCKGLSKQMPNGGAFVIKCTEDRGRPLLMFLDGEEGVKPSEDKSEGAADPARVAQLGGGARQ